MKNIEISVRPAVLNDVADLVEIERISFTDPWTEAMFVSHILSSSGVTLVATDDGVICGFINAYIIDGTPTVMDGECEIANIAVSPEFRRKHIGNMLVAEIFGLAKTRLCSRAFLEVRESNVGAKSLYCKNGFIEYGKRKNYYSNPREDAVLMSCEL